MKVLLTQSIEKLGKCGEIKNVADGYARNYLFPKKLAVAPSSQNIKGIEAEAKRQTEEEAKLVKNLEAVAERLGDTSCTFSVKADENGHLYGSVSEAMIAEALAEKGFEIEARHVSLESPIKELGVFEVEVQLHTELKAKTRVWVVEESDDSEKAGKTDTDEKADAE